MERGDREKLAAKRLLSVVGRHGGAIARTIEQKISDARPLDQRIDPHILIPVRNTLVTEGKLVRVRRHSRDWYAVKDTPEKTIFARIDAQFETLRLTLDNAFVHRIGDVLEIATFRALRETGLPSLGGFRGLTDEPTTKTPKKEEPPTIFGGRELTGNKRFDFLMAANDVWAGVECKNIREWLYPDREEVRHMLRKAIELDIPPILIGRRIPFVTRRLLQPAGVLLWETRQQFYPAEYDNLAQQMRHKDSLGFFDIKVTDYPTPLLHDFITRIVPEELPDARKRFDTFKDLLSLYAFGHLSYTGFAARIRRRQNNTNEDKDEDGDGDNG